MRAGGKNEQGPRNKHCTILPHSLQHGRWRHLSEKLFWKKKKVCPFGKGCRISMKSVLWTSNSGRSRWTTRRPSETFAHFSSFQFSSTVEDCRTKHGTLGRSVKNVCAIWQAHGQFLKQTHRGRVLLYLTSVISHNTKRFLIQWFAFGVTSCYLLQTRLSWEDRSNYPHPSISFSSSPVFFWEGRLFADLGALKVLFDYALPVDLPGFFQ